MKTQYVFSGINIEGKYLQEFNLIRSPIEKISGLKLWDVDQFMDPILFKYIIILNVNLTEYLFYKE
jgi:hypothetical protein